jgi:HAMP domain-containing protein
MLTTTRRIHRPAIACALACALFASAISTATARPLEPTATPVAASSPSSTTAIATAPSNGSKGASKSRQAERLRQIEQTRLQALVDADVAVAGPLHASDFELINPLGEVLTRDDLLGAVGSGAIDFLSNEVTSEFRVRRHGNTAVLRYQHTIDIVVAGIGHLTHPAWTTALYERRNSHWQIVWEQTGAIGPLPLPS